MNTNERPEMTEKQSCHWYLAFTASRAEQRVKQELDQRKIRNYLPLRKITYQWQGRSREALCPQIARCVLIWTSLSDIRQLSGISGLIIPQNIWDYRVPEWQVESYQLLFSQMDTAVEWIPDCLIRHNGSCYRRSFDWVSGRTGYFGHRVSDKDPFSFYGMFSCCCT